MLADEDWAFMLDYFGLTDNGFRYPPRYNIAPTQNVMAVISDGKERRAGLLRWGLIPEWSETEATSFNTFNARVETLLVAPSFRNLISRKRCVIVADGLYECTARAKSHTGSDSRSRKCSAWRDCGVCGGNQTERGKSIPAQLSHANRICS